MPETEGKAETNEWLLAEFCARLASVFETMAGQLPPTQSGMQASAPAISSGAHVWKQPFSGAPGAVWLVADEASWTAAGTHILLAAGLGPEDTDAESTRSSYLETLSQALGGVSQAMSKRVGHEVTPSSGAVADAGQIPSSQIAWARVALTLGGAEAQVFLGMEEALSASLVPPPPQPAKPASGELELAASSQAQASNQSRTFDLLLDVELPVSVSFGSAEVPLKDVLKLTTGSIVELNRTIQEPVEVVVNNCVIARGEVVVVEGNFGVRIKQVVSRQERLRTLR